MNDASNSSRSFQSFLIESDVISSEQVDFILENKVGGDVSLYEALVEFKLISSKELSRLFYSFIGEVSPDILNLDPSVVTLISQEFVKSNRVVALFLHDNCLTVGTPDFFNTVILDRVKALLPDIAFIRAVYLPLESITFLMERYYSYSSLSLYAIASSMSYISNTESGDVNNITIAKFVNKVLSNAIKVGASDIHIEPEEEFIRIRYRIDGIMLDVCELPKCYGPRLIIRIKIISSMNITESRHPQDGQINSSDIGLSANFRVAIHPVISGENIVIRVLSKRATIMELQELGFYEDDISVITKSTKRPEGMILATGPTGSGKTTTLYSILDMLDSVHKNIMTLENPVEFAMPRIMQTSINTDIGLTFQKGLISLMRNDPDVMMVGEIRDTDTATTAVGAAMTGHQVYSSVHANDAVGVVHRLLHMDVKPDFLSGTIICIISQRLIRKPCSNCSYLGDLTDDELRILNKFPGKVPTQMKRIKGCLDCNNTGYKGRTVIAEVLEVDEDIEHLISQSSNRKTIIAHLEDKGFRTIQEDAIRKIKDGIIELNDAIRVVNFTQFMHY